MKKSVVADKPARHDLVWLADAGLLHKTGGQAVAISKAIADGASIAASVLFDGIQQGFRPPLGRYFERLVEMALSCAPGVSDLESNIVVRDTARSLGELDYLFRFDGRWHHLEVAVKYYLFAGSDSDFDDPAYWLGPGLRDSLARKLSKLEKQLSETPRKAQDLGVLREYGCMDNPDSVGLVYGQLFMPVQRFAEQPVLAGEVATGWWVTKSVFLEEEPEHYAVLDKGDWLAGGMDKVTKTWPGLDRGPVMVRVDSAGALQGRGFVVPDDWPDRASQVTGS